uniref:Uncharacterized protein n=1 Tax=Oncorhynchus mykiss TaxID=8022 RepID=A0A8C7P586_ONCMY
MVHFQAVSQPAVIGSPTGRRTIGPAPSGFVTRLVQAGEEVPVWMASVTHLPSLLLPQSPCVLNLLVGVLDDPWVGRNQFPQLRCDPTKLCRLLTLLCSQALQDAFGTAKKA